MFVFTAKLDQLQKSTSKAEQNDCYPNSSWIRTKTRTQYPNSRRIFLSPTLFPFLKSPEKLAEKATNYPTTLIASPAQMSLQQQGSEVLALPCINVSFFILFFSFIPSTMHTPIIFRSLVFHHISHPISSHCDQTSERRKP